MELAFLILAHTDLPQLKRLCVKLSGYGDVYIHVDGKTSDSYVVELKEFLRSAKGKYYVLDKRVNVRWGHILRFLQNAPCSTPRLETEAKSTTGYFFFPV